MPSVAVLGTRGYPSYYGGFETMVRRIAPYLCDEGWDVTVYNRTGIDRRHHVADPRVHTVVTPGIETTSASTLSYGLSAAVHASLRKPDVALIMNVANGFFLPMLKKRGIPTVVNVDGVEWERAKWSKPARAVFYKGAQLVAKHADVIVCDSKAIADLWLREFKRESVYIPYGAETPGPLPPVDRLNGNPYALLVSRFVPENTINEFLDATSVISREWDVVIVGAASHGGPLDHRVRQLAKSNDRVHWFGHLEDDDVLFSLWQHAGTYFHGHSVGGTNPALVQAMACGSPTIARDTIFNREVLSDAGVFTEPNAGDIADAVQTLLADPPRQEELSKRVRREAESRYGWDAVLRAYDETLNDAIGRRPASR